MKFANLHLHSTYSDAQFTPCQLLMIGKSLGYKALALTDHETDGGVREFMSLAKQMDMEAVTGVEFYGVEDGVNLHLTALDFDPEDPALRSFIRERCQKEAEYARKCVERGIRLGHIQQLEWNDILDLAPDNAWICIDTVMWVMEIKKLVPADYDWHQFRLDVFKGPEVKSFKSPPPTAEQVIRTIRKAGGVAVLAHPVNQTRFAGKLLDYGLNGIEICHPSLDDTQSLLAEEAAKEYSLYRLGGTDHTGPMSGCDGKNAVPAFHGIDEEDFFILKERRFG